MSNRAKSGLTAKVLSQLDVKHEMPRDLSIADKILGIAVEFFKSDAYVCHLLFDRVHPKGIAIFSVNLDGLYDIVRHTDSVLVCP